MSSLGIEVLEAVPQPDVVVVCCGGGGLLAGVAAAIKLSGCIKTRIYGVEPEGGKHTQHSSIPILIGRGSHGSVTVMKTCSNFFLLLKTQHVQCTKASLRTSLWAWMQRVLPPDWHLPLQVP